MERVDAIAKRFGFAERTIVRWVKRGCPCSRRKLKGRKGGLPVLWFSESKVSGWMESEGIATKAPAVPEPKPDPVPEPKDVPPDTPPPRGSDEQIDPEDLNLFGVQGAHARLRTMEKVCYSIVVKALNKTDPPESATVIRDKQKKYIEVTEALRRFEKELPKILLERGRVLDTELVRHEQAKVDLAIRNEMLGLSRRVSGRLTKKMKKTEVEDIIDVEVHGILRHIAGGAGIYAPKT